MNVILDNHTVYIRPISELHPSVQALISIARKKGELEIKDINGESIVEDYLSPTEFLERYSFS